MPCIRLARACGVDMDVCGVSGGRVPQMAEEAASSSAAGSVEAPDDDDAEADDEDADADGPDDDRSCSVADERADATNCCSC